VTITIIAAIARNRAIGLRGALPWHISEDLRRFKKLTSGHVVLMGRKTFESLGRPLPNRRNVVVTSALIPGVECYPDPESALRAVADQATVFVIGGGQLFSWMLGRADEFRLTLVHRDAEADTFFPPYEEVLRQSFRLVSREDHDGFSFLDYVRS
jgi:dihydrofolate reductase